MRLIEGYSYKVKSKEEAEQIIEKLNSLEIGLLAGVNNWTEKENILEVCSVPYNFSFYSICFKEPCQTFEEWCEKSIEDYKKSTEKKWDQSKTINIISANISDSREIQTRLFELGYQWISSGKQVTRHTCFKVRDDKTLTSNIESIYESFTGEEFLRILRNMTTFSTSSSPHSTADLPYKVEKTELGAKYTFECGYKGQFTFDIGAEVIVHTGSNDEASEKRGKVIRNKYNEGLGGLNPFIELDTGAHCYPMGRRNLVVTVLSSVPKEESKPLATTKQDEYWEGKRIVTRDNAYVGMKVVRGRDWGWNEQDRDSLYGEIVKILDEGEFSFEVIWKDKYGKVTRSQVWYRGKNVFDLCEYKETSSDSSSSTPYINNYVPTEFAVKMKDTVEQCFDTIAESIQKGKKARMNLSLLSEDGKIEVKLKNSEKNNKQKLNLKLI